MRTAGILTAGFLYSDDFWPCFVMRESVLSFVRSPLNDAVQGELPVGCTYSPFMTWTTRKLSKLP